MPEKGGAERWGDGMGMGRWVCGCIREWLGVTKINDVSG